MWATNRRFGGSWNLEPPYSALNIDVALSKSNEVRSNIQTSTQ
jgi:hypothetical protein